MARTSKPWYRKDRKAWFVTIEGERHNLGPDRKLAHQQFHELMRRPEKPAVQPSLLVVLGDRFLDWVEKHRSAKTYIWYQSRLQLFTKRYPTLQADCLKPFHIQEWIDSFDLSSGSKRNYARAVTRCMNWCEEQGLIERSPLAHFKKPRGGKRDKVISADEYAAIRQQIRNDDFRDLVMFIWETGARAAECLAIEPRHVDHTNSRIVFPVSEEKMERAPRIIYLNAAARGIVERRMTAGGKNVFSNTAGAAWTTESVNCAFISLQIRLGMASIKKKGLAVSDDEVREFAATLQPQRKVRGKTVAKTERELLNEARRKLTYKLACLHASKVCLTNFRHTWCHNALTSGLDALTVSMLMGHADPSMVARVYSHLNHAPDYLLKAVERAGRKASAM